MNEWWIDYHIIMIIEYIYDDSTRTQHNHQKRFFCTSTIKHCLLWWYAWVLFIISSQWRKQKTTTTIHSNFNYTRAQFVLWCRSDNNRKETFTGTRVYKLFCIFFLNRIWKLYGCCMLCCIITGGMISLVLLFLLMHGSTVVPGMNTTAPLLLLV